MQSKTSQILRGTLGALVLQTLFIGSAPASPSSGVPNSLVSLDSTAHQLVDTYQREVPRDRRGNISKDGSRLLQAMRNLENASHALKVTTDERRGYRQAQQDLSSLRLSANLTAEYARGVRLSERTRGLLGRTRVLVSDVESQRNVIYARASNKRDRYDDNDHRGHDHDHDDNRGRDNDRDRDRNRLPGVLGKLFN